MDKRTDDSVPRADGLIANADYCCEIPVLQYALDHRKMMKLVSGSQPRRD